MSFFEFPHTRTYDTDLGWIIKNLKTAEDAINALNQWIEETQPTIDELKEIVDAMNAGELPEGVQDGIRIWMQENAIDLVGELVKMVFFGLTMDGYFVAYIPESWNDIIFGTSGFDDFPPGVEYGHLTLSLDIGGE